MRVVVADRAVHLALERHALDRGDLRARAARRRWPSPCRAWSASRAGRACARASARAACACASARSVGGDRRAARAAARRAAPRASISACARLLMSSDVQAKWMNSADARDLGHAREALLQPVLDRLDVVVGRALDRLDARGVVGAKTSRARRRARARASAANGGTSAIAGSSASASSHATSTRTRCADQPELAEDARAAARPCRVAAVERRQGRQSGSSFSHCRAAPEARREMPMKSSMPRGTNGGDP